LTFIVCEEIFFLLKCPARIQLDLCYSLQQLKVRFWFFPQTIPKSEVVG